jgi:KipI family sensor histidine kinase inhibitor
MRWEWVGKGLLILRDLPGDPPDVAAHLGGSKIPGLLECSPAWETVGVYVGPGFAGVEAVVRSLAGFHPSSRTETTVHVVPVDYGAGPDLEEAASLCGISPDELVSIHAGQPWPIRCLGFCPGFAYCGPLPSPLDLAPRRSVPRPRVPARSVALASGQTGIYPAEKPGGWQLIGQTELEVVRGDWCLFAPGDMIQFKPI